MSQSNPYDNPVTNAVTISGPTPLSIGLGIVGAILGGVVGYYLTVTISGWGFYPLLLPSLLVALLCVGFARSSSVVFVAISAVVALVTAIVVEWSMFAFLDDAGNELGLLYFVQNIHESNGGFTLVVVIGNAICAGFLASLGTKKFS